MILTLSWREWLEDLRVDRFDDFGYAMRVVAAMPNDRTAYIFDTEAPSAWRELRSYCVKNLVQIYNALLDPGEPKDYRTMRHDDILSRVTERIIKRGKMTEVQHTTEDGSSIDPVTEKAFSFKPVALGPFSPIRDGTKLAEILRYAARGTMTYTSIGEHVDLDRATVIDRMRVGLGKDHGIGHVADENDIVSMVIPEDKTLADLFKPAADEPERAARGAKPVAVGKEFVPVREGTRLAKIIRFVNESDINVTHDDIAEHVGMEKAKLVAVMRTQLAKNHGIGHEVGVSGAVTLVLPEGKTHADLVKAPAEPKPKSDAPRQQGSYAMKSKTEEAARGVRPEKPVVTSPANLHRQKHFDKLSDLADAGDYDAVRAYHMKGIDSYSKLINQYRDLLLMAYETDRVSQAAE